MGRLWVGAGFLLFALAAQAGVDLPDRVEGRMLDGSRYTLADSQGSITVLAVWSPESLASRKSIGELQRFAEGFRDRGVRTVALSLAGDEAKVRRFVAEYQLGLPVGMLGENDLGALREEALPVVYVFDREGKFRGAKKGLFRLRDLEGLVEPLLREGAAESKAP